jgi:hypothetical protein
LPCRPIASETHQTAYWRFGARDNEPCDNTIKKQRAARKHTIWCVSQRDKMTRRKGDNDICCAVASDNATRKSVIHIMYYQPSFTFENDKL